MANKKGQGLSINMLVIIALAVFVVFIVLGFTTGGWTKFAGLFGAATTGAGSGDEAARITCDSFCTQYANAGRPGIDTGDVWETKLISDRNDIDLDGDGTIGTTEKYYCVKDTRSSPVTQVGNELAPNCAVTFV
ncbi:MAG: hypothetical protein QGI80_02545 [archaeon]|nr:hypothetical protein [archaeon]